MTDTDETTDKPKRGPGRPKGLGKVPGSGRKPGTPNRDRAATIEKIMREADPLLFLCKVARGDRMSAAAEPGVRKKTWWIPTGDQRISAAQTLARKVLPDMKATEHSGNVTQSFPTVVERILVGPVSKPAEPAQPPATGNGFDKDAPAPRAAVDLMTNRRK